MLDFILKNHQKSTIKITHFVCFTAPPLRGLVKIRAGDTESSQDNVWEIKSTILNELLFDDSLATVKQGCPLCRSAIADAIG
jgi:hypothetical protein